MRIWRIVCLALGGLRRRPLRVALTCLGVTIASGALVSMVAFALGLQSQAEAPFEKLGLLSNIEVRPGKGSDSDDSSALNDAALERMAAIPRVALAYPDFRANDIKISYGERTRSGIAFGLPREAALFGVMEEIREAVSGLGERGMFHESSEFRKKGLLYLGIVGDGYAVPFVLLNDPGFEAINDKDGGVIYTDMFYGDLDGDSHMDLSVGRFPGGPEAVSLQVERTRLLSIVCCSAHNTSPFSPFRYCTSARMLCMI